MKNERCDFTSDSFYLFLKHGTTHPFCIDASKQSFFFLSLSLSIPYSTYPTTNSTNQSTIDPLYSFVLHIFVTVTLLFRDSSVSTVKLRANTTDLSIYPKNRKLKRRRMRFRFDPVFTDSRRPLLIEFQSRGALAPRPEKAFKPITILEFPAAARVSRGGIIS